MGVIRPGCAMPKNSHFSYGSTFLLYSQLYIKKCRLFQKFLFFPLVCDLDKQWYPEAEREETKGEETMAMTNL